LPRRLQLLTVAFFCNSGACVLFFVSEWIRPWLLTAQMRRGQHSLHEACGAAAAQHGAEHDLGFDQSVGDRTWPTEHETKLADGLEAFVALLRTPEWLVLVWMLSASAQGIHCLVHLVRHDEQTQTPANGQAYVPAMAFRAFVLAALAGGVGVASAQNTNLPPFKLQTSMMLYDGATPARIYWEYDSQQSTYQDAIDLCLRGNFPGGDLRGEMQASGGYTALSPTTLPIYKDTIVGAQSLLVSDWQATPAGQAAGLDEAGVIAKWWNLHFFVAEDQHYHVQGSDVVVVGGTTTAAPSASSSALTVTTAATASSSAAEIVPAGPAGTICVPLNGTAPPTTPRPTTFTAVGGFFVTMAPPLPEGVFNPCQGDKAPETYEEFQEEKRKEEEEARRLEAILNFALYVLIFIILLPTIIVPILGTTFLSAPFAFLYKALAVNSIPESRYHTPLQKNPDVMDIEYPWYSCTEDMQLFMHACFCYASRVAHTYEAAEIMPFWEAYKRAVLFNVFGGPGFCEQRYQLRKMKGLSYDWWDLNEKEQRLAYVEAFFCSICYAYQEAKEVDEAARISISCCCQVADTEDKYAEFPIVGAAIQAKKEEGEAGLPTKPGAAGETKAGAAGKSGKAGAAAEGGDGSAAPLTKSTLQQLEQATGGERGQAIPADQQSFASKVIQDFESHAGGPGASTARGAAKSGKTKSRNKHVDDDDDAVSVISRRVSKTTVDGDMAALGDSNSPKGGALALPGGVYGSPEDGVHEEDGDEEEHQLTEEQQRAREERRERRAEKARERRALEGVMTEDERLRKRTRLQSIHAREKAKGGGIPIEMNSSKRRAQMERDRIAKEERRREQEKERMKQSGLLPAESTAMSSADDATSVTGHTHPLAARSVHGAIDDTRQKSNASDTDVFSLQTKQRSKKGSTYATSETTDDSEYSSTYIAKIEAKRQKKLQKKLDKSYIDNADDASEQSDTAKALQRVKLPSGVFTKKQFKRLDELKIRKLFREADADSSGSINIEEFGLFLDQRFAVRPNMSTLNMLLKMIDDNNDGEIDEEEFVAFFMLVLRYANDAKKLQEMKQKKFFISVCSNGALLLSFGFLTLFAYEAAKQCEEVCLDESLACPGETRSHCVLRCFEPKEPNMYVEYGLVSGMMFWMLSSGMMIFMMFLFCCPAFFACVGYCCGGAGAGRKDNQPSQAYLEEVGEEPVDPEASSPSKLRKQVADMYALVKPRAKILSRADYEAADREQVLNTLAKGNQIYFQPITQGKNKKHHDPRVPDPLRIMESEFETEDAFMEALQNNPLEPIAWVPPGLADDFVVQVVQKEEDDEEQNRKKRRKEKLRRMQKKQKKSDQLAIADAQESSGPVESSPAAMKPIGNIQQTVPLKPHEKFRHADTAEIREMGAQQAKMLHGFADGMTSMVFKHDPEKEARLKHNAQMAAEDAVLDDVLGQAEADAAEQQRIKAMIERSETLAPEGELEFGTEEEDVEYDEHGNPIIDENAKLRRRMERERQKEAMLRQQLAIPMTEEERVRQQYYATPMYNQSVEMQRNHTQWSNWEKDFRSQQRGAVRKRVNQLIVAAGEDPEKYKAALVVAKQNGPGNVCMAFDEDDIRRMTRKLKDLTLAKKEADAEREQRVQALVAQLEGAMLSRDPYALEESLANLRTLTAGTRQHARLLSIARAELPIVQKEAEQSRVARGEQALAPHWSTYVAPDLGPPPPGTGDPQAFQSPQRKKGSGG